MNLTIIIPFYNGHGTIRRLVATLPTSLPVIIVDDLSDQPMTQQTFESNPNVRVLNLNKKGYFSGAVNAGIKACDTDVLVLNQDVFFDGREWLKILVDNRDKYAMIGEGVAGVHPAWPKGYIHGTFMFLRRDMIEKVGFLNEVDYPLWGATCEFQLRACRMGFQALPFRPIPDFYHSRESGARFGDSIQTLLSRQPQDQNWLVRVPPMISVIIPAFQHGKYLESAVNSLVGGKTDLGFVDYPGQTFQSFEVLIVDDASTDETLEVGKSLADPWKGVHYIRRQTNGGTPAANNTGISRSHGKFITVLCGDDMMAVDRLEMLYRAIENDPDSVYYDNLQMFMDGKKTKVLGLPDYNFDEILYKNQMHCGIMWARKAWDIVGGYPLEMRHGREDWAINIALGRAGFCGKHLKNYAGYLYRREGQNRTLTNTTRAWNERFLNQLKNLYPDVYNGGRPMGCCGSGGRPVVTKNSKFTSQSAPLPGKAGLSTIEYLGANTGKETIYGPTGQRYVYSAIKPFFYVDPRDVKFFLDIYEGRKPMFQSVKYIPPVEKEVIVADTLAEAVEQAESKDLPEAISEDLLTVESPENGVESVSLLESDLISTDPGDYSVSKFKDWLSGQSVETLDVDQMILIESEGKNRAGIISLLKGLSA